MPTGTHGRQRSPYSRLALTIVLAALTALLGSLNGLGRVDQIAYDRAISLARLPPTGDVVLVVIDDESLSALGRWPWPRVVHAALLDRLQGARAVGVDIVFAEPELARADSDRVFADAIRKQGRVVLPVVLNDNQASTLVERPVAPLAAAAAGLGYINIVPDVDGVVRRVTWTQEVQGVEWLHFALAMLRVGGEDATVRRFVESLPTGATLIPYRGPPGSFHTVPYVSVLRGDLPADYFRGKYVMVGAWATGMGDVYPAPVSHSTSGISGVEIMGSMLQSVREGRVVHAAPSWLSALASAVPVLFLCLALPRLSPRQTVLYATLLFLVVLVGATVMLTWGDLWIPPAAALLGLAICYPIWSWRSQEAALRYMTKEMARLRREYPPVMHEAYPQDLRISRSLDQHVAELDQALSRVRNLRRFLIDGLDGMPDATLVVDQAGRLQFRNRPAVLYFLNLSIRPPRVGSALAPVLEQAFEDVATRQLISASLRTRSELPGASTVQDRVSIEVRDRAGQDLLIRCAPIHTARGAHAGLVVTLSDISAIRQAERQREETLRFISHDMRAPQNSILALVALNQREQVSGAPQDVLTRIASLAHRTLGLVDDFIQLTRAESMDISHAKLNLADVVHNAADEFWAAAQGRNITVHVQDPPTPAITYGDQALILRAVCNLVDNAIKYSNVGARVELRVTSAEDATWRIEVQDTGAGIAADEQERLFQPFFRTGEAHESDVGGSGLGLAFVKTVAQRHGGHITVQSERGVGTTFTLSLPMALDDTAYEN